MKLFTFLILLYSCLCMSQSKLNNVTPFMKQVVSQFPNVRDVAIFENEAVFSAQSVMGDISVLIYVKNIKQTFYQTY